MLYLLMLYPVIMLYILVKVRVKTTLFNQKLCHQQITGGNPKTFLLSSLGHNILFSHFLSDLKASFSADHCRLLLFKQINNDL